MYYRTDIARESYDLSASRIEGVHLSTEEYKNFNVERVNVISTEAASVLDKPVGTYITIDPKVNLAFQDETVAEMSNQIAEELRTLLPDINGDCHILVVGLGNRHVTPDALGPATVDRMFITRHLADQIPEALPNELQSVSAIAPGVLGTTGLEILEVVKGLVEQTHPDALICIDALAARSTDRINRTVQICDTGISPGSGIGNYRKTLDKETVGIPVIAIGIPLVVYASTIAADCISLLINETGQRENPQLEKMIGNVVREHYGPLIVTPKDIDLLVEKAADLIAQGINKALHHAYYREIEVLFR